MRTVDLANTEQKRTAILRAAMQCFAENGLQKTSMGDICKVAGMRSGHVYYYFANKDAIVEAAWRIGMDELVTQFEELIDGENIISLIVDMHSKAEAERRSWGMTPGLRLEFLAESARNPNLRAIEDEQDKRIVNAIMKVVERAVASGHLDASIDQLAFSRAIILIWDGLAITRLYGSFNLEAYRDAIQKIVAPWLTSPAEDIVAQSAIQRGK